MSAEHETYINPQSPLMDATLALTTILAERPLLNGDEIWKAVCAFDNVAQRGGGGLEGDLRASILAAGIDGLVGYLHTAVNISSPVERKAARTSVRGAVMATLKATRADISGEMPPILRAGSAGYMELLAAFGVLIDVADREALIGYNLDAHTDERVSSVPDAAQDTPREKDGKPKKASKVDKLIALGKDASLTYTNDGTAYATVPVASANGDARRETCPVKGSAYRRWLSTRFYTVHDGQGARDGDLKDAISTLEAIALNDGKQHAVYQRIGAAPDGTVYLDLADDAGRVVEICRDGTWRVIDDDDAVAGLPILFERSPGMLPLPVPTRGGSVDLLRAFVNFPDDDAFRLALSWAVMAFCPTGPYPILALQGEQGSAKSTTARSLRALVDPTKAPLRSPPRDEKALVVAAIKSRVLAYDNIGTVQDWFSDALCRAATGGGFSARALYTDSDEKIYEFTKPIALTGITQFVTAADLLDRSIVLTLPHFAGRGYRDEGVMAAAFEAARPAILGALLDAAALALRERRSLDDPPRMADFAAWAYAAAPALGWTGDAFLAAYVGARASEAVAGLDASPVGRAIQEMMRLRVRADSAEPWSGTATSLLTALNADDGTNDGKGAAARLDIDTKRREWPQQPKALGDALRRIAPSLRAAEIDVAFGRTGGGNRERFITITHMETACKPASPASPASLTSTFTGETPLDLGTQGDAGDAGRDAGGTQGYSPNDAWGDAGDAGDAGLQAIYKTSPNVEADAGIGPLDTCLYCGSPSPGGVCCDACREPAPPSERSHGVGGQLP